jgi:heme exporter protein D
VRSGVDFSSWQGVFTTFLGLAVVTLVMVGVRLLVMQTVQRRRERENRQINERLRTLIAAYKVLGGSFTGDLAVDPAHLRDLVKAAQRTGESTASASIASPEANKEETVAGLGSDRRRRIRDAVEAALSDVILLGTADQVRLAVAAANDLVAGRPVETAELVSALRTFIREALDLEPVPEFDMPRQGPARPSSSGSRGGAMGQARSDRSGRGGAGSGEGAQGAAGIGLAGLHDDAPR